MRFEFQNRADDQRHGTTSGYTRHQKAGERPCDACYAAKAEYDKRWRSADDTTKKSRLSARAQARALRDLRQKHPDEYRELYVQHKVALMWEVD